ncbi:uncharacterized protein FIBRA_00418 [Fibroporia radiculosa]|uniref:F-box domain-containing protein n=1 Tax=Fibroporia radiculosa TaxID=599839 RepID=J4I7X5_9APHY|nr:uncharacterized protein FIBRA_00418 [Fibroporia radiculosa]CCL98421.1 predicted protein [Fibroporia radiculosa]
MPATLSSFPEELLERILLLVLTPAPPPSHPRPTWHQPPPSIPGATSVAPLLVCRTWLRIATPLHYRTPILRSARATAHLAATLHAHPALGRCVRALRVEGSFDALPDVVRWCPFLEAFDMTVDNGTAPPPSLSPARGHDVVDEHVRAFCSAFSGMRKLRHLVIRKNAYLTQARPTLVFEELGKAIRQWRDLESVNIDFRFSPSPASAAFAAALAVAPKLRYVRAALPAVWNTTLLEISANPALERIQLTPDTELVGAHLFLSEASKHPRLLELIRAGTPVMRRRARTTTAIPLTASAPHSISHAGGCPPPLPRGSAVAARVANSVPAGSLQKRGVWVCYKTYLGGSDPTRAKQTRSKCGDVDLAGMRMRDVEWDAGRPGNVARCNVKDVVYPAPVSTECRADEKSPAAKRRIAFRAAAGSSAPAILLGVFASCARSAVLFHLPPAGRRHGRRLEEKKGDDEKDDRTGLRRARLACACWCPGVLGDRSQDRGRDHLRAVDLQLPLALRTGVRPFRTASH